MMTACNVAIALLTLIKAGLIIATPTFAAAAVISISSRELFYCFSNVVFSMMIIWGTSREQPCPRFFGLYLFP
jgi:hypothetical protein